MAYALSVGHGPSHAAKEALLGAARGLDGRNTALDLCYTPRCRMAPRDVTSKNICYVGGCGLQLSGIEERN